VVPLGPSLGPRPPPAAVWNSDLKQGRSEIGPYLDPTDRRR